MPYMDCCWGSDVGRETHARVGAVLHVRRDLLGRDALVGILVTLVVLVLVGATLGCARGRRCTAGGLRAVLGAAARRRGRRTVGGGQSVCRGACELLGLSTGGDDGRC